jgi:hypothetical protein
MIPLPDILLPGSRELAVGEPRGPGLQVQAEIAHAHEIRTMTR